MTAVQNATASYKSPQLTIDRNLIDLAIPEGKEVTSYGIHNANIIAKDSEGNKKTNRHDFIASDFNIPNISMILGFPWLQNVNPDICWKSKTWIYRGEAQLINMLTSNEFWNECKEGPMYVSVIKNITITKGLETLPDPYWEYVDVFDISQTNILVLDKLLWESGDYSG